MKFCVLSDIHRDINSGIDFNLSHDISIFTLIAGDIAGIPEIRKNWIDTQISNGYKGIFIEGNHIIYNQSKKTLDELYSDLNEEFPIDTQSFSFLENNYVLLKDDENAESVLIIGCTFWTDFEYPHHNPSLSGYWAEKGMNDYKFRAIKTLDESEYPYRKAKNRWNDGVRNMRWEDTAKFHADSLAYIKKCMKELQGQYNKVVIVTHHAPTSASIDKQYVNSDLNSAYVSQLGDFILDNPQIKLWVHGHIHQPADYQVGECRVVCNPYGYAIHYENVNFKKDFIVEI